MIEVLEVPCSTCKNRETDFCKKNICVKCVLYGIPDETCVGDILRISESGKNEKNNG